MELNDEERKQIYQENDRIAMATLQPEIIEAIAHACNAVGHAVDLLVVEGITPAIASGNVIASTVAYMMVTSDG